MATIAAEAAYVDAKAAFRATILAAAARLAESGREPSSNQIARAAGLAPGSVRSIRLEMIREGTWVLPGLAGPDKAAARAARKAEDDRRKARDRVLRASREAKRVRAEAEARAEANERDQAGEPPELGPSYRRLLRWVAERPHGATTGEVARAMEITTGQASGRLERLVRLGLVLCEALDIEEELVVWHRSDVPEPPDPAVEAKRRKAEQEREAARREAKERRERFRSYKAEVERRRREIQEGWSEERRRKQERIAPVVLRPLRTAVDGRAGR